MGSVARPASGGAAPVFINTAGNRTGSGVTSLALAATSLTAGNHIFVFVHIGSSTITASLSDTAGNTYTALTKVTSGSAIGGQWFHCLNAAGDASNVVTLTLSSAATCGLRSYQFSGSGLAFSSQATVGSGGSAVASLTSGSITTSSAGVLLIGYAVSGSTTNITFSDSITGDFIGAGAGGTNSGKLGYLLTTTGFSAEQVTATPALSRVSVIPACAFSFP
jgi:hypothetical protein